MKQKVVRKKYLRQGFVRSGISFGSALAIVLSYTENSSILWAIVWLKLATSFLKTEIFVEVEPGFTTKIRYSFSFATIDSCYMSLLIASAVAIDKNLELSESARDVRTTGTAVPRMTPATSAFPRIVSNL